MLPHPPPLIHCHHCSKFYWLKDAKLIGEIMPIHEPTEHEYYQAIDEGFAANPADEKSLRILAWWRQNDEFRGSTRNRPRRPWRLTPEARANMEALLNLLDDNSTHDRIMKAEALRQLGEFGAAKQLLKDLDAGNADQAVAQIAALCDQRDPSVRIVRIG